MLVSFSKINITAEKNSRAAILSLLQENGIVEILKMDDSAEAVTKTHSGIESSTNYQLHRLKTSIDFISRYRKRDRGFKNFKKTIETVFNPEFNVSKKEMEHIISSFDYKKTTDEILDIQKNINQCQNIIRESAADLKAIEPWQNIGFAQSEKEALKNIGIFLGVIPLKLPINDLLKKLGEKTNNLFFVRTVVKNKTGKQIAVGFLKQDEKIVREILASFYFKEAPVICPDKKPREAADDLKEKIREAKKNSVNLEKRIREIAEHDYKNLCVAHDYLLWESEKEANFFKIISGRYVFSMDCWIEGKNIGSLKKAISAITPHFAITELKIKTKEELPIVIENKIFKPYEAVTNVYGLPSQNEPDPTPFLAPFFAVFFGLALTDAGYGIILVLLSWIFIKIFKIPISQQNLFRLLIQAGIMTIILGALFGGWFGLTPKDIPDSFGLIKNFLVKIQLIDPIGEPLMVMLIAFILGIIHIWFGIFVGAWWQFKNNNIERAILDYAVWNYFLITIMSWLITKFGFFTQLKTTFFYFLLTGAAAIIFTQGRKHKNIFLKFGAGILSLYNLVGYLSDVLSYSRLLALGLATGIIAMVINLIAVIFKDLAPFGWLGWILAILILIGGHLFNLMINALGAFIHSSRLQFVEFFPKFMEGGGKKFQPLAKKNYYVKITDLWS